MRIWLMAPLIALLIMVPFIPSISATMLLDSYGTGNHDDTIQIADTHPSATVTSAAGQSFQNIDIDAHLGSVKFYLSDLGGAPDGNLVAVLYAHTGTYGTSSLPTGAALATSDPIAANTLTAGWVLYEFPFPTPYKMTANTYYTIFVYRTATADTVFFGTDASAPAHAGNAFRYNAGAWAAINTEDAVFYLYAYAYGSGDGTYRFLLGNPIYENNTDAGSVTISAITSSTAETFSINEEIWYYAPTMPNYFTWEVSAGIFRRIYVDAEENFTTMMPEDTFTAFGFTIKDFTGETESGTIYFETRRVVGGTERTVERAPVLHTINLITMTLVENRNYVVQFTVGATVYQYSFFSSPLDTTPTIVLNEITFSRTIQLSETYIHVDADRPTATSLRVNYTNTRADTNLVQIAVREMDGTLVGGANIASDAFTYTYSPVDNETSYYFDLAIDTDLWDPTWKKTLPWEPVFVGLPDPFTVLGTVGGLDTSRIMGFVFIVFTALLFSAKDVTIGCFSVAVTTALLSYWGFFPVDNTILALVVGVSVLVGLGLRGR